jgi:phosphoglycerate dehydrogenase-like enzyme
VRQVYITPHISAVSFPADVAEIFAENLELYLGHGQGGGDSGAGGLKHTVAWEKGY